jgi:hypothetical protein
MFHDTSGYWFIKYCFSKLNMTSNPVIMWPLLLAHCRNNKFLPIRNSKNPVKFTFHLSHDGNTRGLYFRLCDSQLNAFHREEDKLQNNIDFFPWDSFFCGTSAPSESGPPHYRGFTITLRHTTLGRTPMDEWSAWRRDLYPTTHNSPAAFEPAITASERLPTARPLGSAPWGMEINICS